jgi:hypothetical protein
MDQRHQGIEVPIQVELVKAEFFPPGAPFVGKKGTMGFRRAAAAYHCYTALEEITGEART